MTEYICQWSNLGVAGSGVDRKPPKESVHNYNNAAKLNAHSLIVTFKLVISRC